MLDRYLASPHYGEHRARYWLDAARYGDTHGIHIDNYREIWPYRDWVIQAYNRNLTFDRFTIEQLAGDLLPHPTLDQRIATGFHRCNVTTNEGGIIEDEYAEIYAKDRVDTTSAVWLGLTVGCATCHDHKFDPISQKDFYALGAFFRNTVQRVLDGNIATTPPVVTVPRAEDRASWERVTARLEAIRAEMAEAPRAAAGPFERWLETRTKQETAHPFGGKGEIYRLDVRALETGAAPVEQCDSPIPGRPALRFQKNEGVAVATAPRLEADKPFSIAVSFHFPTAEQKYVIAAHQNPKEKNRGWVLDVGARVIGLKVTGDGGRTIETRAGHFEQLKPGEWHHAIVTYDGSRRESGIGFFLNGRAIPTQGYGLLELTGDIGVDAPLVLGPMLANGAIADFRMFDHAVSESEARLLAEWPAIESALATATTDLSPGARSSLLTYFLFHEHGPFMALVREQNSLTAESRAIAGRSATTLVMQERTDHRPTAHLLHRGAYDQKRELVECNTPTILPPMAAALPRNRLGFAQWLFTGDHPLTARVAVNRMWQEVFGTGLVKTVDDFGSQGERPSNPELLDWLAVDFRESGWDMKRFYKQLLTTAAYRQKAAATAEKLEKDPENRLLSRGPRFRLSGEAVRDYALAASGLLVPRIGGPSVKPYQPDGVWEAVGMVVSNTRFYKRDPGEALYRRSLYTFWKRGAPPASLDIFNAPTRESCIVRREQTNTPLQALVTMNDVQFVEAARTLAERTMQNAADFDGRLDFMTLRLLARPLTAAERAIARRAYADFRRYYEGAPGDAAKLLHTGESAPDPALEPADHAAMTMLANQLLNLDEVLNK
jgi:hypothetical protein